MSGLASAQTVLSLCGEVDEVSVLQPALGRFRALVGGAWQRVQSIFRRSSSSGTAADEEDLEVGGSHDSSDGAENESKAAFFEGDFRTMPPSAWEALSRGLDLLHILQLLLHCTAITARVRIAPGHDRAIGKNGSKCANI